MEGHPVVAPNRAARVSKRSCDGTEPRGHGTSGTFAGIRAAARTTDVQDPVKPSVRSLMSLVITR